MQQRRHITWTRKRARAVTRQQNLYSSWENSSKILKTNFKSRSLEPFEVFLPHRFTGHTSLLRRIDIGYSYSFIYSARFVVVHEKSVGRDFKCQIFGEIKCVRRFPCESLIKIMTKLSRVFGAWSMVNWLKREKHKFTIELRETANRKVCRSNPIIIAISQYFVTNYFGGSSLAAEL